MNRDASCDTHLTQKHRGSPRTSDEGQLPSADGQPSSNTCNLLGSYEGECGSMAGNFKVYIVSIKILCSLLPFPPLVKHIETRTDWAKCEYIGYRQQLGSQRLGSNLVDDDNTCQVSICHVWRWRHLALASTTLIWYDGTGSTSRQPSLTSWSVCLRAESGQASLLVLSCWPSMCRSGVFVHMHR